MRNKPIGLSHVHRIASEAEDFDDHFSGTTIGTFPTMYGVLSTPNDKAAV
jgi:hypothetical protein